MVAKKLAAEAHAANRCRAVRGVQLDDDRCTGGPGLVVPLHFRRLVEDLLAQGIVFLNAGLPVKISVERVGLSRKSSDMLGLLWMASARPDSFVPRCSAPVRRRRGRCREGRASLAVPIHIAHGERRVVEKGGVHGFAYECRELADLEQFRADDVLDVNAADLILVVEGEGEVDLRRAGPDGSHRAVHDDVAILFRRRGPLALAVDRGLGPDAGDALQGIVVALKVRLPTCTTMSWAKCGAASVAAARSPVDSAFV